MAIKVVHSSVKTGGRDEWRTPRPFFTKYHKLYNFTIDAAADDTNHLLPRWWGPGSSLGADALAVSWKGETCWLNPPYSLNKLFVAKAAEERYNGVTSVVLIPARTDTAFWHDYIWDEDKETWRHGVRGNFLRGRLSFDIEIPAENTLFPDEGVAVMESDNGAPFPSALIVFDGTL